MTTQRHLLLCVFLLHAVVLVLGAHDDEHSYDFWNASAHNVTLPNHFRIDESVGKIIIAANNSICHLSLDLQELNDVFNVAPENGVNVECRIFHGREPEDCHNFHHVLLMPNPNTTASITSNGVEYDLDTTILVCGSNALSPMCHYRLRSNLQEISSFSGAKFCPYAQSNGVTSIWTSTGRLISATPLDAQPMSYGITASDSPYRGTPQIGTADNDVWFNKSPFFVSMMEIGDYIYTFFREEAIEISQAEDKVLYSRVSRICKNDTGATPISTELPAGINLFTTFLKARMSCTTGSGTTIPYHFNNLQDTFYLESGSYDGEAGQKHLYAVFTSPDNGPLGSVVCVYTFGTHNNDLENVFKGDYLRRTGSGFVSETNFVPLSCATSRSVADAERYQLMEATATQSNSDRPLLQMSGFAFRRVVVDSVQALDGVTYEVMFVAAQEEGLDVFLLKSTYVPSRTDEDKFHVSQLVELEPGSVRESAPTVTQMRLYGTGSGAYVYVGTTEGIYRVSASRCEQYTGCCSCIAARDPYCAFDLGTGLCVAVDDGNRMSADLIQDVVAGGTSLCARASSGTSAPNADGDTEEQAICTGNTGTPVSTDTVSTETDGVPTPTTQSTGTTPMTSPTVNTGGVGAQESSSSTHTWTIVGSVAGFVGGMVLGIILMAMYKYRTNFWWWKMVARQSPGAAEKGATGRKVSGASNYTKEDEYKKNNLEHAFQNSYSAQPCGSPAKLQLSHNPITTSNPITSFSETPKLAPCPVLPPVPPYKPRSGSLLTSASQSSLSSNPPHPPYNPKNAATSPYRSAASPSHRPTPNPNLKSDRRVQEHLSNSAREAYGHNIVARTPSIDASKSPRSPNGSVPVSFHAHMHSDPVVEIHDAMTGCSSC